jgi:hypothetical protein
MQADVTKTISTLVPNTGDGRSRSERWRILGGLAFSGAYLVGVGALMWLRRKDLTGLELNALGDFFAGAFGPLALLWLVLGYFQQGEELKQNTDALKQQAEELRQSAEHQAALVETTRAQASAEIDRYREDRIRQKLKAQPRFSIEADSDPMSLNMYITLKITNHGSECMESYAWCEGEDEEGGCQLNIPSNHPVLRRNDTMKGELVIPLTWKDSSIHISIAYQDSDDEEQVQTYEGFLTRSKRGFTVEFETYSEMAERERFHMKILENLAV